MWFSSVRHSLSTDYERNLFWHTMCAHRPTRSCILEVLIIVWLYQWNKINCIWLYNCYIELSTSLSTLWFRVSTLRAWLKAKGLPLLGELLADSVSVLEDWTDWTNRVAFVKSFHLANLLNDKRSSNLFLKKSSDMFFQSEVEVSVGRARQRKTWGFNGKHGLLRSQNQVCEPESSYVSFNGDPGHVPKVDRGLVCLLALSVGRAIMWKAQFDRKPDSKGATAVRFFVFVCRNCIVMHCLAVCFKGGSTETLGKAFDRLHRWVLSMNSISSVCKHEMSCSLTCERFFWRLLPPGFFLSFCSLFLQVGVVAKRQQERLNSGRLAWLWAGDVTLWRTSRHFGENHRPSCGQYVQCEYSVSTVNMFGHFDSLALTLAVWVSEIRSRQEMATAAEACKYRHASKQSSQGPAAQNHLSAFLHLSLSSFSIQISTFKPA